MAPRAEVTTFIASGTSTITTPRRVTFAAGTNAYNDGGGTSSVSAWNDPTIVPDQALVSGPASQVKNLADVATERIIMTGRTDTFTQNAAVVSDSPFVRIVDPLAVQVTVPVLAEVGPTLPATTTTDQ